MSTISAFDSAAVAAQLFENGIAIVDGIVSRDEFIDFCTSLGTIIHHHDADDTGVTVVAESEPSMVGDGLDGFSNHELMLHTDRATLFSPPNLMALHCRQQATVGGETRVVDGQQLYKLLGQRAPDILKWAVSANQLMYFDKKHSYQGPIFRRISDSTVSLQFRCDGRGFYKYADLLTLSQFLRYADEIEQRLKLDPGQTLILNNRRWLHGRSSFRGRRELWRILLNNIEQFGEGFFHHADTS